MKKEMIEEDLPLIGTYLNVSSLCFKPNSTRKRVLKLSTVPNSPCYGLSLLHGTIALSAIFKNNFHILFTRLSLKSCRSFLGNTEILYQLICKSSLLAFISFSLIIQIISSLALIKSFFF